MTSNHFRIDEQTRTIRERGQNGHPRTVASYPPTMTARQAREGIGLYEMLVLSPELLGRIKPGMDLGEFTRAAMDSGMSPLRCAAAAHVAAGLTTIEEAQTVLPPET